MLKNNDYTSIKCGQGNKKYIFKKGNEENVKSKISNISKIKSINNKFINKPKGNEIEDIDNYFLDNFVNIKLYISKIQKILLDEFSIKQDKRKKTIVQQLLRRNRLEALDYGYYKVLPNRSNL